MVGRKRDREFVEQKMGFLPYRDPKIEGLY